MVNKMLTLFEIEFKRIQKIYSAVLGILIFGNVAVFIFTFYLSIMELEETLGYKGGISLLKNREGISAFPVGGMGIFTYQLSFSILIGAFLWCLYYGMAIWYKDFSSKTKPIYTLFMLPENKFIIFLSKLITMLTLIYGVILVQFLCWILGGLIIKSLTGVSFTYIINCINRTFFKLGIIAIPRINRLEFLMIYILGPILAMTVLFTGIMVHKTVKKIGGVLGVTYVISIIMTYTSITILYNTYTDLLLKVHILFYLTVFVLSLLVSYSTLTKKIYV